MLVCTSALLSIGSSLRKQRLEPTESYGEVSVSTDKTINKIDAEEEWDKEFKVSLEEAEASAIGLSVSKYKLYLNLKRELDRLESQIQLIPTKSKDHTPLESRDYYTLRTMSGDRHVIYACCDCAHCFEDNLLDNMIRIESEIEGLLM